MFILTIIFMVILRNLKEQKENDTLTINRLVCPNYILLAINIVIYGFKKI